MTRRFNQYTPSTPAPTDANRCQSKTLRGERCRLPRMKGNAHRCNLHGDDPTRMCNNLRKRMLTMTLEEFMRTGPEFRDRLNLEIHRSIKSGDKYIDWFACELEHLSPFSKYWGNDSASKYDCGAQTGAGHKCRSKTVMGTDRCVDHGNDISKMSPGSARFKMLTASLQNFMKWDNNDRDFLRRELKRAAATNDHVIDWFKCEQEHFEKINGRHTLYQGDGNYLVFNGPVVRIEIPARQYGKTASILLNADEFVFSDKWKAQQKQAIQKIMKRVMKDGAFAECGYVGKKAPYEAPNHVDVHYSDGRKAEAPTIKMPDDPASHAWYVWETALDERTRHVCKPAIKTTEQVTVRVAVDKLYKQSRYTADLLPASAAIRIEVKNIEGRWIEKDSFLFKGKTMSCFYKDFQFTRGEYKPGDVRIVCQDTHEDTVSKIAISEIKVEQTRTWRMR